jgi:hypothetical protein
MRPDVRDRLFLPLVVPLLLVGAILLGVFALAMLFLFNTYAVALTLAIIIGAGVLAYFGFESAGGEDMTRAKRAVVVLALAVPIGIGTLTAVDVIAVEGEKGIEAEPHVTVPEDAPVVVADNIEFGVVDPETGEVDWDEVVVTLSTAEDPAVIVFDNQDTAPHDIDIFESEEALEERRVEEQILDGEIIEGGTETVYEFEAPEAGEYPFYCSVHPQMRGTAVFEEDE